MVVYLQHQTKFLIMKCWKQISTNDTKQKLQKDPSSQNQWFQLRICSRESLLDFKWWDEKFKRPSSYTNIILVLILQLVGNIHLELEITCFQSTSSSSKPRECTNLYQIYLDLTLDFNQNWKKTILNTDLTLTQNFILNIQNYFE